MEIFKKVGPRIILVEYRGKLCGIVTRKDVLKFQFKMENHENPRSEEDIEGEREREERLWGLILGTADWIRSKMAFKRRVALRLDGEVPDGIEADPAEFELELDDRRRSDEL